MRFFLLVFILLVVVVFLLVFSLLVFVLFLSFSFCSYSGRAVVGAFPTPPSIEPLKMRKTKRGSPYLPQNLEPEWGVWAIRGRGGKGKRVGNECLTLTFWIVVSLMGCWLHTFCVCSCLLGRRLLTVVLARFKLPGFHMVALELVPC